MEATDYDLVRELGRGGFARVFEARDPEGQSVALKRALPVPTANKRLAREIEIQASISNPHVMPILDAGEDEEGMWYTMPIAQGNLVNMWLGGKLGPDATAVALAVARAVALGLDD